MPTIKLPASGQEVEFRGLSFDEADEYLEREAKAAASENKTLALRALARESVSTSNPEAWEIAQQHNRDASALHRAVLKETFGDQDELGNSERSGAAEATESA